MKLIELVERVSNLIGEKLDCPEILDVDYISHITWQESEVPDSCKAIWVIKGPKNIIGYSIWYEAEIKDGKLESLTRWYSDDATEPYQIETIIE